MYHNICTSTNLLWRQTIGSNTWIMTTLNITLIRVIFTTDWYLGKHMQIIFPRSTQQWISPWYEWDSITWQWCRRVWSYTFFIKGRLILEISPMHLAVCNYSRQNKMQEILSEGMKKRAMCSLVMEGDSSNSIVWMLKSCRLCFVYNVTIAKRELLSDLFKFNSLNA